MAISSETTARIAAAPEHSQVTSLGTTAVLVGGLRPKTPGEEVQVATMDVAAGKLAKLEMTEDSAVVARGAGTRSACARVHVMSRLFSHIFGSAFFSSRLNAVRIVFRVCVFCFSVLCVQYA